MLSLFTRRGQASRQTLPAMSFSTSSSTPAAAKPAPASTKISAATKAANRAVRKTKKSSAFRSESFERIRILKQNMYSPAPAPLRMGRLRWLRHWTIHRAWQLFKRQERETLERERTRMHAGMWNACEELRLMVGPGDRGEGYLYRVAMEKKGVWGKDAVPIEYARFQTDSAPKNGWNHEWKR